MSVTRQIDALKTFGFSEIEAAVYCFLLEESPATGYRISHAIGKAPANTYKALAALEQKGAILLDDGASKLCRAVPYKELFAALETQFRDRRQSAEKALSELEPAPADDRIYQLRSADQVYARAERMIAEATEIVMIDGFPAPVARLEPFIEEAVARGVCVGATLYNETQSRWAAELGVVASSRSPLVLERWPGVQLNIIADAREHLFAMFAPDAERILQAVWSNSRYLSCLHHASAASEIFASEAIRMGLHYEEPFKKFLELALTQFRPPGLRDLLAPQSKNDGET